MKVQVFSYAGYKAEQEPRRFSLGSRLIDVLAILDRWQGPDHRYFKVKGSDQADYILRYDQQADHWELTLMDTTHSTDKERGGMSALTPQQTSAGPCRINRIHHPGGGKRPVILLHGAAFEAATWLDLGTLDLLLENGYPVHALDMPGFGGSEKCRAAKNEVIKEYIIRENLQQPVIIGPSRGGRYALETYFFYPEYVGGLVLVGSVGITEHKSRFRSISIPCLLVWGSADTVSDPENGRFLEREIPDSRLVILEGAPHPCYLEQKGLWHQSLLSFLEEKFDAIQG